MKVLVTGASGFVGSALVKHLAKNFEISVVAMVRSSQDITKNNNIEYRLSKIDSLGEINIFLDDIDVVIHAAGRAHVMKEKSLDPLKEFRRVNTMGTISLAKSSAKSGVKQFIFLSTIKVNGDSNSNIESFSANDIPNPNDPYSLSKFEAELGLKKIASSTKLRYTIIRPTIIYGPGVKGNLSTLIKLIKLKVPIPFKGLNKNRRSMVGLDNLVDLISVCIDHPKALNKLFLVSDNDDISTVRLIRLLGKAVEHSPRMFYLPNRVFAYMAKLFGFRESYKRITGSLRVNTEETCKILDWNPPYSVEYGFKKLGKKL
jgi:nucleoside-diphosphate-sugar epimerase